MRPYAKPSDGGARIAPLAALPVFLSLAGRPAVVAGGTDAAAWKAELLAAAGAHVTVYASAPGEDMRDLLARGPVDGRLSLVRRGWMRNDLSGAAFAVCDAVTDEEAAAFAAAARAAGVPANVIDRPDHGTATFGAIVNRSPVVVAIATGGAAPVLAQAVRRRVESALPACLGSWATLAKRIRADLAARLPLRTSRRAFWEAFAERAFRKAPPAEEEGVLPLVAENQGRVILVGTGSGDPDLLTLKALRALQAADVILYDERVASDVLDLARREAKRMMVASGGRASAGSLTLRLARGGRCVVRLVAGNPVLCRRDSGVFTCLGIPLEVVPGVAVPRKTSSAKPLLPRSGGLLR